MVYVVATYCDCKLTVLAVHGARALLARASNSSKANDDVDPNDSNQLFAGSVVVDSLN